MSTISIGMATGWRVSEADDDAREVESMSDAPVIVRFSLDGDHGAE